MLDILNKIMSEELGKPQKPEANPWYLDITHSLVASSVGSVGDPILPVGHQCKPSKPSVESKLNLLTATRPPMLAIALFPSALRPV